MYSLQFDDIVIQRLHAEAVPWQEKVDALHVMAQKLVEQYRNDDVTQVNNSISETDKRWKALMEKYVHSFSLVHFIKCFSSLLRFNQV